MQPDGVSPWVISGLVMGAAAVLLIAGAFVASERLFPSPNLHRRERGPDQGEVRRREEIRQYLSAIGESFEEDSEVEGHAVAFHLPARDVAVTFDARAFLGLQDSGTHAILVEHEMPGAHLGERLPFETPDLGPDGSDAGRADDGPRWANGRFGRDRVDEGVGGWAGDGSGSGRQATAGLERARIDAAFSTLGLSTDASLEAVRAAYRERVKEVHPDQGGDEEAFQRLQRAYDVAREHAD